MIRRLGILAVFAVVFALGGLYVKASWADWRDVYSRSGALSRVTCAYISADGQSNFGTFTQIPGGGVATAAHVVDTIAFGSGRVVRGPEYSVSYHDPDLDVAFGPGAWNSVDARSIPILGHERVYLVGCPARGPAQLLTGKYYAAHETPGRVWIVLDEGQEPLVPGFSGGAVYTYSSPIPVAIVTAETTMALNGRRMHMGLATSLRYAFSKAQGRITAPNLSAALDPRRNWPKPETP